MLVTVALLAGLALQPGSKTVPGQPGTDGAGGDTAPKPATSAPAPADPAPAPSDVTPLVVAAAVPFPHPLITEVLYAVPSGPAGDANRDGRREVAGDEFIELINPHDRPIQLFGYALTDSQEPGKGQLKFTFPALELAPGGVVVVFNGHASTFAGPVGDGKSPPVATDPAFGGAWVFTMRNASGKVALGNSGDHVLLTAPDGTRVQRVWWSETPVAPSAPESTVPPGAGKPPPIVEDAAPAVQRCSVQRDGILPTGRFVSHQDAEHAPFSPGVFTIVRPPAAPPR